MKIKRQAVIDAIDKIVATHEKTVVEWEKATVVWRRQQAQRWMKEDKPKYAQLTKVIAKANSERRPITNEDLVGIFRSNRYGGFDLPTHDETSMLPSEIVVGSKRTPKPGILNTGKLGAMKALLEAVEDDFVSDSVLSRLGLKEQVTEVFRVAVTMGALHS